MERKLTSFSANKLRVLFLDGKISCEDILKDVFENIEDREPVVGAFLSTFREDAFEKGKALDTKRSKGKPLGKLAGIPVAIKDNINVEGKLTTCGSKFLSNYKATFNASVVDFLLSEDAIIVGKTNLDEFAMGSSCENSALKKTTNPWNKNYVAGGSSGGSAAAVAAGFVPIALGSDTGGSIRTPASFCGVFGFKPTYGIVSRYGLVAFGSSLDQIGPFANNVEDIALTMEVISGACNKDSTKIVKNCDFCQVVEDITNDRCEDGKKVIGIPWKFLESVNGEVKGAILKSIEMIKNRGHQVVDIDFDYEDYAIAAYYILSTAEASTNLSRFDGIRYGKRSKNAKDIKEVYLMSRNEGFGLEVKRRIILGTFVLSKGYQDAYYTKAQKVRTMIIKEYKKAFENCDFILSPTTPCTAFEMGAVRNPLDMYLVDAFTIVQNLAGLPAISIPVGLSLDKLPIGIQLTGPQMSDENLLRFAYEMEKICEQKDSK